MKRALWMLVCFITLSVNSITAFEVDIDGLTYELSGVSAMVIHVASGNTNTIIRIPPTVTYEGLTYTVNEIGTKCFVNIVHDSSSGSSRYCKLFKNGSMVDVGGRNDFYVASYSGIKYEAYIRNSSPQLAKMNSYVEEIFLPETIERIGTYAFSNSFITKVQLSEGVKYIEEGAFHSPLLTEIDLPNTVKSISDYAFRNSKLKEIIIPASVTSLGENSFESCSLLRTITYMGTTPPSGWTATYNTYVPSKKTYSNPSYSINNANITEMISFSGDTFTYTGKAPKVTWINNVEGYTTVLTMPELSTDAGTHQVNIPAKFTKDEESFDVEIPYSYTIQPAPLTAKVKDASRLYGEDDPSFSISYTGFVNNEDESVITTVPIATTTAKANSKVGTYPITLSGGTAKNYKLEYEEGTLTVKKAPVTINVVESTKVYGQENPSFSLNYTGLRNGEKTPVWATAPTFTTEATAKSDVGTYAVNVTCEPQNYDATIVQGNLNITQAPLTIGVEDATRSYCGKEPTYTFTYSGFVNGDDEGVLITKPTIQTDVQATSNVGDYTIAPTGAQAKNYAISYEEGTLNITPAPLKVKANSCSRVYGEENPAFPLSYEGFVNGETEAVLLSQPVAKTSANIKSNVGTYDIQVTGGRAFNYALNYENGQLSITPKDLKISVGDYERPYNEENPTFNFIYEGLAGNDTGASLQTQPVVRTTATKTSNVGTYPLEVDGAYSPNYNISYASGSLDIVKAEQTLEWEQDLSLLTVNDQVELMATSTSGLPITYTMEAIDGAELYPAGRKSYLECKAPCEFVIKAVQEGNSNYYSTQRIIKNVKISRADDGEEYFITIRMGDGGVLMQSVELEQTYTYAVSADDGWEVNTVTFDGADMTEQLIDGQFSTPVITGNSELNVVFKQNETGLKKVMSHSNVKVYASNKNITVTGADMNAKVNVYSINGAFVTSAIGNTTIPLEHGVYIVKVGQESFKVGL